MSQSNTTKVPIMKSLTFPGFHLKDKKS